MIISNRQQTYTQEEEKEIDRLETKSFDSLIKCQYVRVYTADVGGNNFLFFKNPLRAVTAINLWTTAGFKVIRFYPNFNLHIEGAGCKPGRLPTFTLILCNLGRS